MEYIFECARFCFFSIIVDNLYKSVWVLTFLFECITNFFQFRRRPCKLQRTGLQLPRYFPLALTKLVANERQKPALADLDIFSLDCSKEVNKYGQFKESKSA